jgi:phosphate transport system substrate-binding protein
VLANGSARIRPSPVAPTAARETKHTRLVLWHSARRKLQTIDAMHDSLFMTTTRLVVRALKIAVAVGLTCAGCAKTSGRSISLLGSTSIQPFAEVLAEHYVKQNPGELVEVQGGGSTAGLQATANGLTDIGMCSRALKSEEKEQFTPILIARDGLAVVVNPQNPVAAAGLSLEQLRGLFTGRVTNWKNVGGKDGPVRPITREEGSGTRESFVKLVMGKERISRRALTQESNGAVKELVKGDPAAIGYMSLGLVGKEIRAVPIGGTQPTAENVLAGRYALARPLLFVTKGAASPAAQKFIDFVLSPEGQELLEKEGLVRAE